MENKNYGGTLTRLYGEPKYFSKRGLPLITQNINPDGEGPRGMLTMENYDKWYHMYVIHADGTVEERYKTITPDDDEYCWRNHAIVPYAFHTTAVALGLEYDSRTFAMVCERFVEDFLEGDWTELSKYLPIKEVN